jgi:hypothetical protein
MVWREATLVLGLGALLVTLWGGIFLPYLPNADGSLGGDYQYMFPAYLAGYFWFRANGLLEVPWFTPAFCGGLPLFPNLIGGYYSVPQFLTFALSPLQAVRVTALAFAAVGYGGFYLFLRRRALLGPWTSALGGALFMFNGFYAYRVLLGHLSFHGFMLLPIAAWSVIPASRDRLIAGRRDVLALLAGSLVLAYSVHSGMAQLMPQMLAMLAGVACFVAFAEAWTARRYGIVALRMTLIGLVGLSLCIAKVVAALAYLRQFPRTMYPLPGFEGLSTTLEVALRSLFFGAAHEFAPSVMTNDAFSFPRRFEYGVSPVPLVLIGLGLATSIAGFSKSVKIPRPRWRNLVPILGLIGVLALPVLLNWYTPTWNAFLKELPFLGQSSSMTRWLTVYIPIVVLVTSWAIDQPAWPRRMTRVIALVGMGAVVAFNALEDKSHYAIPEYFPEKIERAWRQVREGHLKPRVRMILVPRDENLEVHTPIGRNDSLAFGGSQMLCYEPMFGYGLESFPFKTLHPGPIDGLGDVVKGYFNLKNPACFLYPAENECEPGDHYPIQRRDDALAFASYQPVAFAVPLRQRVANGINAAALLVLPILAVLCIPRRRASPDARRAR